MVRWQLKELAEPERWNAHRLAKATGLAYNTVYAIWENKTRRADLATIGKLARTINVQPGDLLVWEESQSEHTLHDTP
jgi:DNA-binding Xre family transcriptional regulator